MIDITSIEDRAEVVPEVIVMTSAEVLKKK